MRNDLIFLAASRTPRNSGGIDKHLEGYATIQFMSAGGVQLSYDDCEYLLEGAWFWPAHPGPRIRFHAAPGYEFWFHRHIGFQGSLVRQWMLEGLWPNAPCPAPPGRDWGEFFDEMTRLSKSAGNWSRKRTINLLEQLLLELAEARAQPAERAGWLLRVLEKLEQSGETAPDYKLLADELGLSLSVLRRRFKAAMGVSMHAHFVQTRIGAARGLLCDTDLPLKQIAAQLGYNNVYFFARQFRELVGVPPGVYRKSRQN